MKMIFNHNLLLTITKPQLILGFCFLFLFISPLYSNEELEEKLYSKMTDYNAEKAVENLLIALETIEDGKKNAFKFDQNKIFGELKDFIFKIEVKNYNYYNEKIINYLFSGLKIIKN